MNFAFYKKSTFNKDETITNLKKVVKEKGYKLIDQVDLPKSKSILFIITKNQILEDIVKEDKNLIGLVPLTILLKEGKKDILVGMGNPTILGGVSNNTEIQDISLELENDFRDMLKQITNAEDAKVSKVKLYSSTTCPYCVMEKKWLDENKVEHDVVYVDKDQNEAQKMVQETGQMGVPVTTIVYDDNETEHIVGFDKNRLASILNIK